MTRNLIAATGAAFVHPYDDYDIIAGQATAVSELLEQVPDLEVLLAPVGGGGLLSGMAVAGRAARSDMKIYGVEPEQVDDAMRSLRTGTLHPPTNRPTIADGLRIALGVRNFAIIQTHVDDIVTVTEEEIVEALRLIWEILKIVVEPSSAVPLAAILRRKVNVEGRRVGVVLTGGNVDLGNLPWMQVNGAAARRDSADRRAASKRRG
jgi:threonine dehydratase